MVLLARGSALPGSGSALASNKVLFPPGPKQLRLEVSFRWFQVSYPYFATGPRG